MSMNELNESNLRLTVVEDGKLYKKDFEHYTDKTDTELYDTSIKFDKLKANLLTLEHYCERYVPIKIQ